MVITPWFAWTLALLIVAFVALSLITDRDGGVKRKLRYIPVVAVAAALVVASFVPATAPSRSAALTQDRFLSTVKYAAASAGKPVPEVGSSSANIGPVADIVAYELDQSVATEYVESENPDAERRYLLRVSDMEGFAACVTFLPSVGAVRVEEREACDPS